MNNILDQAFIDWVDLQKTAVNKTLAGTGPDEDILPMLVVESNEEGNNALVSIPELGIPGMKDILTTIVIPGFLLKLKAKYGALIMTAWAVEGPNADLKDAKGKRLQPSENPNRSEAVTIIAFKSGEEQLHMGRLMRSTNAAPIAYWEKPLIWKAATNSETKIDGRCTNFHKFCQ